MRWGSLWCILCVCVQQVFVLHDDAHICPWFFCKNMLLQLLLRATDECHIGKQNLRQ